MKKTILISYKACPTHFFGDSYEFPYMLTFQHTNFWGLIKYQSTSRYVVSMFQSIKEYTDHWDDLIKAQNPIK